MRLSAVFLVFLFLFCPKPTLQPDSSSGNDPGACSAFQGTPETPASAVSRLLREKKFDEALPLARKEAETSFRENGMGSSKTIRAYTDLGLALNGKMEWKEALKTFQTALSAAEELFGKDSEALCDILDGLGFALNGLKKREAVDQFIRAITIRFRAGTSNRAALVSDLIRVGALYHNERKYVSAGYFFAILDVVRDPANPGVIHGLDFSTGKMVAFDASKNLPCVVRYADLAPTVTTPEGKVLHEFELRGKPFTPATKIRGDKVVFPRDLQLNVFEASVYFRVTVSAQGDVVNFERLCNLPAIEPFLAGPEKTIRKWKYQPAELGGVPVTSTFVTSITYFSGQ